MLFLPVDPMDKEHEDPDTIDLNAPRLQCMHEAWKKHQNTILGRNQTEFHLGQLYCENCLDGTSHSNKFFFAEKQLPSVWDSQTVTALPNHIVCFWECHRWPQDHHATQTVTTPEHELPHMPKSISIASAMPTLPTSAKRAVPSWLSLAMRRETWPFLRTTSLQLHPPCRRAVWRATPSVPLLVWPFRCGGEHKRLRVDRQLHTPKDWKAFGHNFQSSAIKCLP